MVQMLLKLIFVHADLLKLFSFSGETFQEKSNLQQLKELRTHLEVVVTEDCQLSMPFGRLNVEIPMAPHAAEMETFGSSPSSDPFLLRNRDSKENSEDSGGTSKESSESSTVTCLEDTVGSNLAQKFLDVLQAAVKVRVCNAPLVSVLPRPEACALGESDVVMGMARVAVLFSGGVDSAVIAALVDRYVGESTLLDSLLHLLLLFSMVSKFSWKMYDFVNLLL